MNKKISKRLFQIVLFTGTIISLYYVPWPILFAWAPLLPNTVQEQVDKAQDYGFDGIIVYVDKAGQENFYASGLKNRATKEAADPHSLFKIASVGKLYVALAVAKLERKELLSLDEPLATYLPELKGKIDNVEEITLRMMVQHRSGIPNYTNTPNYWVDPPETEQKTLELVFGLPANFEPGQGYQYSNTNYLLLGRVMNEVLTFSHLIFIQEYILKPLKLQNTFMTHQGVDMENIMSGYYVGYDRDLKQDDRGSIIATAQDVGKFVRALNNGTAFTDQEEQNIYNSIYELGHTGLIPGYQTIAHYHADIDAVVVQFTNTVDFSGYNWSLSEIMYDRILNIIREE